MKTRAMALCLLMGFIYSDTATSLTTLNKRDIAVIRLQLDTPDSFAFITFVDLDPNTVIYFTSVGANVSGIFQQGNTNINDGTFAYTVPAGGLSAGDIIKWEIATNTPDFSVYTDSISTRTTEKNFSSNGESLTVFQKNGSPGGGAEALSSPNFVSITNTASTQFVGDPIDANQTNLPAGLSVSAPISALALGAGPGVEDEWDDVIYQGSYTFPDVETAKNSFFNPANYYKTNDRFDPPYVTAVDNIPQSAAIAVPANNPPTASNFVVNTTENSTYIFSTALFAYNDADGDAMDHLSIQLAPDNGTLYVDVNNNDSFDNGEQLTDGATVSKANLDAGNLQYIQNNNSINTSFDFEVNDGSDDSTGNYMAAIDVTAIPAVINAVNTPPAATYISGQNLDFSVIFNKDVDVNLSNGTPSLSITIGSSTAAADYQSGNTSNTLLFRYTIQSGDLDTNGININGLNLNNGTIVGNGSLGANLTLNNIGNTSMVLVDAVAPAIQSVTRHMPVSSPTNADQVTLRYTFTEPVNSIQSGNFFSNNPSAINTIISTPVSSSVYDVEFSGSNLEEFNGTIVFGFITAGITDNAGNSMTSSNVIGANENSYEFINIYFIGGTITGLLEGNYMVLSNNQGDEEVITMNGPYVFNSSFVHQENYTAEIDLQPNDPIQLCQIINASSAINSDDVINIDVFCDASTELIYRNGFESEE